MNNFKKNFYLSAVMFLLGMNFPVHGTTTITLLDEQRMDKVIRLLRNLQIEDIDSLKNLKHEELLVTANFTEGIKYGRGIGVEQDYKKSFDCIKFSADKGYTPAEYELGVMYENGRGVTANLNTAIEYYTKAADKGHSTAANNLGVIYELGTSLVPNVLISRDKDKAIFYYAKAVDKGHELAMKNLEHLLDEEEEN